MARVIVVGGGISGLSTATFLEDSGHDVVVLESAAVPGGNVQSDLVDGRTLDHAANGWLNNEPAMSRLLERVGLADRTLAAGGGYSTRWIFSNGVMQPAPMSPPAMVKTELISFWSKLRVLLEPFIRRGPAEVDESVADFVRRRLGQAFVDAMVGPMVAGVYAADPEKLSLRAALPRMYQLEQTHRSLFIAMMKLRRGGAPAGHLTTLPGGAGALTSHLADRLGSRLQCSRPVTAIERRRSGWQVHTAGGSEEADAVVLACPGHAQARITRSLDSELAAQLDAIPYAPVAVVVSAWKPGSWAREPEGFGVLLAKDAQASMGGVLGTLFTSCVYPQQALEGEHLLRTIIGGAIAPDAARGDEQALIGIARAGQRAMLGEERADPEMVRVYRYAQGIPQYTLGHRVRVQAVRAAQSRYEGLFFTGNHMEGIGVKDCARQGESAAKAVLARLG